MDHCSPFVASALLECSPIPRGDAPSPFSSEGRRAVHWSRQEEGGAPKACIEQTFALCRCGSELPLARSDSCSSPPTMKCGLTTSLSSSFDSEDLLNDSSAICNSSACIKACCSSREASLSVALPYSDLEDDPLCCGESLEEDTTTDFTKLLPSTAARAARPTPSTFCHSEVCEAISNDLRRETELAPSRRGDGLDGEARSLVMSWLVEAATGCRLKTETIFSAASLFDRFCTNAETLPPAHMLQLLALACLSLASKQEEVAQHPSASWLSLATTSTGQPLYRMDDLQKMEFLVLVTLEWRLRAPNAFSFLQHFIYLLRTASGSDAGVMPEQPALEQTFISCAHFVAELSLLQQDLLAHSSSTVAAACLVMAEWVVKGSAEAAGGSLRCASVLKDVCGLDLGGLTPCVESLHPLFAKATAAQQLEALGMLRPVVQRYHDAQLAAHAAW